MWLNHFYHNANLQSYSSNGLATAHSCHNFCMQPSHIYHASKLQHHVSNGVKWKPVCILNFRKVNDLKKAFKGHPRSNLKINLNSQPMGSYLLPNKSGHLSVWPEHAIYWCEQKWMTLRSWVQCNPKSKVNVDMNSWHITYQPCQMCQQFKTTCSGGLLVISCK